MLRSQISSKLTTELMSHCFSCGSRSKTGMVNRVAKTIFSTLCVQSILCLYLFRKFCGCPCLPPPSPNLFSPSSPFPSLSPPSFFSPASLFLSHSSLSDSNVKYITLSWLLYLVKFFVLQEVHRTVSTLLQTINRLILGVMMLATSM